LFLWKLLAKSCVYNEKTDSNDVTYAIDCGDRENETVSGVYDEKPDLNDVTTGYDVGDSENKALIDVNVRKLILMMLLLPMTMGKVRLRLTVVYARSRRNMMQNLV
jgi:hypothetical protein